jgi:hypothetical protein
MSSASYVVGKLSLLAFNDEMLQDACGAFLADEGLMKVVFVNVGDIGTLGFDQLKSWIAKSCVAMDQSTEVGIHLGRYK